MQSGHTEVLFLSSETRHGVTSEIMFISALECNIWDNSTISFQVAHYFIQLHGHVLNDFFRCYAALGMSDEAFNHMIEVLACAHQSKATQELFVRDFFRIVQVAGRSSIFIVYFPMTRNAFDNDMLNHLCHFFTSLQGAMRPYISINLLPTLFFH